MVSIGVFPSEALAGSPIHRGGLWVGDRVVEESAKGRVAEFAESVIGKTARNHEIVSFGEGLTDNLSGNANAIRPVFRSAGVNNSTTSFVGRQVDTFFSIHCFKNFSIYGVRHANLIIGNGNGPKLRGDVLGGLLPSVSVRKPNLMVSVLLERRQNFDAARGNPSSLVTLQGVSGVNEGEISDYSRSDCRDCNDWIGHTVEKFPDTLRPPFDTVVKILVATAIFVVFVVSCAFLPRLLAVGIWVSVALWFYHFPDWLRLFRF